MTDDYKVIRIKNLNKLNDLQGSEEILVDTVNYAKKIDVNTLIEYMKSKIDIDLDEDQIKQMIQDIIDEQQSEDGTVYIQRIYTETQSLVSNTPITFMLPTSKVTGLITQFFINGILEGVEDENLIVSGNQVQFTPSETISNAKCMILYSSSAKELPKNYQYVSVDITLDEPEVTITNLFDAKFKQEGSSLNVDWGDGTSEVLYCDSMLKISGEHTYQNAGVYTVSLVDEFGQLTTCLFNSQSTKCVSKVNRVEGTEILSLASMFKDQPMDIQFASGFRFKTPNVTNIASIFATSGISVVPVDIFYETINVTIVTGIFQNSKITYIDGDLLKNMPDISSSGGFAKAATFLTEVGAGLFKDKKFLTSAGQSFYGCSSLTTVGDEMYSGCSELLDLNGHFLGCTILEDIPVNTLRGCFKVQNLANFAQGVNKLTTLHEDLFSDCGDVTTIATMLKNNNTITHLPAGLLRAFTKCTNATSAFGYMSALTEVGVGFLNPLAENCENLSQIFRSSSKLTGNINNIISVEFPKASNVSYLFNGGKLLTGSANDVISLFTLPPSTNNLAFTTCTALSDFATIPTGWK